jgi:hypothetical protein
VSKLGTSFGPSVLVSTFLALAAGSSGRAWAHKNGVEATSCDGCHTGGKTPTITLTADPMNPAIGQAVTLTITVSQTNGPEAGFYLTTDISGEGTFKAIEAGTAADSGGVTHTMPRTGSGGVTTFKASWSAAMATGVQFSVYALSANGDGTDRGDGGGEAHLSMVCGCTGTTYYLDQDADGYGSEDPRFPTREDCTQPMGYSSNKTDCDDYQETIHPGAPEICNGKDDNCDGKIDEGTNASLCGSPSLACVNGMCAPGGPGEGGASTATGGTSGSGGRTGQSFGTGGAGARDAGGATGGASSAGAGSGPTAGGSSGGATEIPARDAGAVGSGGSSASLGSGGSSAGPAEVSSSVGGCSVDPTGSPTGSSSPFPSVLWALLAAPALSRSRRRSPSNRA